MKKLPLTILCMLAICAPLYSVTLIKNKKLQFDGIVTPDKPAASVTHAARELYYHIKKATVRKLPIIKESAAKPDKRYIYLGNCKQNAALAPEKMEWNHGIIKVTADSIHIAGLDSRANLYAQTSSTGTLFAAYEFLEKFLGIRWLWPGELGEVIPYQRTITIPEGSYAFKPLLRTSCFRGGTIHKSRVPGWSSKENMENFAKSQRLWLLRHRFSQDRRLIGGHAFREYFDRYHKTNPDFFSMLPDGTRRLNPYKWSQRSAYATMCVSNPRLVSTVVKNWAAADKNDILNLNENDSAAECTCDNCLAADDSKIPVAERRAAAKKLFDQKKRDWEYAMGDTSNRYAKWFLAVQKEADKINPDNRISGLIYANYCEPATVKLNDRIILRFCPPAMAPWTKEKIADYKRLWDGWAKTGASLIFRPNFPADGHYFPIMHHVVFYDLFTFAAKRNMIGSDLCADIGEYQVQAVSNYVIAALNRNEIKTLDALEDDYYSAFGAAKAKIKAYTEYLKELTFKQYSIESKSNSLEGGDLFRYMVLSADKTFTPQAMAKLEAMLNDAANTPKLDEKSAARIQMLKNGLEHCKLAMAAQVEFRKYKAGGPVEPFFKAVDAIDDFRLKLEPLGYMNVGQARYLDNLAWRNIPGFKRKY